MQTATAPSPLKMRRLEEGLTVEELAVKAGCAGSTIRLIEQNWSGYSPDLASRIARALGVKSLDQIV